MDFDDIEYPLDGHAYVWVKPANGKFWSDVTNDDHHSERGHEYRPAKLSGNPPEHQLRGSQLDGRRISLIGSPYGYRLETFELGGEFNFKETPAFKI